MSLKDHRAQQRLGRDGPQAQISSEGVCDHPDCVRCCRLRCLCAVQPVADVASAHLQLHQRCAS